MKKNKTKKIIKDLIPYIIILMLVILFRSFIATPVKVDGKSMFPTLSGNEIMILNKLGKVDRFDIVVVKNNNDDLIKRVVGLPGETIEIINNNVYIDGKKIDDIYGSGESSDYAKRKLEKNEYFVLGDNRENSMDSRTIGPIKDTQIEGTTSFVIFPFNKLGNVDNQE